MKIRNAEEKDIPVIEKLLMQVLNIHAEERPDLFIPDTVKYTPDELIAMFQNPETPVFCAVDENDQVLGYAMTIQKHRAHSNNMTDVSTLFIDDICVDEKCRGMHVGKQIYQYVKNWAAEQGFYNITLNVWSKNVNAQKFYKAMGMEPMESVMEQILGQKES